MFTLNSARILTLTAIMLFISACQPAASTALPPATEPQALDVATAGANITPSLLKTEMGDFEIASARLVDEANGVQAQAGQKILLVFLSQPGLEKLDPNNFSLEAFSNMTHASGVEIYVLGSDGSRTISTMGGWVGDEFAMGFIIPAEAGPYTLHWTGNSQIVLNIEE